MKLEGKVAVITGAGRGIGRAVALAFSHEGARLVIASRTATELDQTLTLLNAAGGAFAVPTDVSEVGQVERLVKHTIDRFGQLDILVNVAAIQGPVGPLWQADLQQWRATLAVNLLGTVYCCHAAVPHMIDSGKGKIINFAGGGATGPRPNFSAYAASKAAVVRLTETLAEELGALQIDVNAIAPGTVNTRMLDAIATAGAEAGAEGAVVAALRSDGTGGVPAELAADLAVFLATAESDGLTGRLISAPHDDWQNWDGTRIKELCSRPWLTLRRLDQFTLRLLNQR